MNMRDHSTLHTYTAPVFSLIVLVLETINTTHGVIGYLNLTRLCHED